MGSIIQKIKKAIKYPLAASVILLGYEKAAFIPDEIYLRMMFRYFTGRKLNIKNPQTYNEKLQWIKLYDRKPIYTIMVDKVKAREFVENRIGNNYLIPLLGIWESPDQIDFSSLPNQFVLKCNHNSGKGMCICKDKSKLDIERTKKKLNEGLSENYFYLGREWPYKNVPRRILGEKYMEDESGEGLNDYKVMCFDGEPKLIELHMGRFTDHQSQDFYDIHWNKLSISQNMVSQYKVSKTISPPPPALEEMVKLSKILAADTMHLRVDWYSVNGRLYFGELTFFDGSGFDPYDKYEDDLMLGSWITLPNSK
ncbi:MAG: hypothetical protein IKS54_04865 [Erysipelotrichaceae bacterium]|nr:hypothetical protein [Erysipelotrichaceae bacterium]